MSVVSIKKLEYVYRQYVRRGHTPARAAYLTDQWRKWKESKNGTRAARSTG